MPLYAYWLLDMVRMYWMLGNFRTGVFSLNRPFELVTFAILTANASALNIVVGHELLHRRQLVHKVSGTLVYSKMLYSHFYIEHRKGHHTFVGTPRDPATAQYNENLYPFLLRTMTGSYGSVWKIESERIELVYGKDASLF